MASNYRISYHIKEFLVLLFFSWAMVACFVAFQYHREKLLKVESIDAMLQIKNLHILDVIENDSSKLSELDALPRKKLKNLRITVLDILGNVIYDNDVDNLKTMDNHLNRPEIIEALGDGSGFSVQRMSQSVDKLFFYSATKGKKYIVRTAVPYDHSLRQMLASDGEFLWVMIGITLVFSIIGYFVTLRSGLVISRLNDFAAKAERGERIYADEAFPNNELGSISSNIVRLYSHLQEALVERDKQHEKAIFEQNEKNRIKRQLTNNINHELKTPVAAILCCIETIKDHPELSYEKKMEFLNRCYKSAERLNQLLNDVSLITRMEDGSTAITKTKISLSESIAEAINESNIDVPDSNNNMKIVKNIPDTELPIIANAQILVSVFRNLIDNAIKYSGGTEIYINVTESDEMYSITFADNGNGVPEEHIQHIFERFYRVFDGRSRQLGGTGLGLSIVKNAVLLHGGSIGVYNRKSGGLEFYFTLSKK